MISRLRAWFVPLFCLCALTALPAAAQGTVIQGSGTDPAGDATDGVAQHDIVNVVASYDSTGSIAVTLTLAEAPTAATSRYVFVWVGTFSGSQCKLPLGAVAAITFPGDPSALGVVSENTSIEYPATKAHSGASITLSSSGAGFVDKPYNCAWATVDDPSAGDHDTTAPIPLSPPPPPPVQPATVPLTRTQLLSRALKACKAKRGQARRTCERRARAKYSPPLTVAQKLARAVRACRTQRTASARARCITKARNRYAPKPTTGLAGRVYYFPGTDPANLCGGVCWKGYTFVDGRWATDDLRKNEPLFPDCSTATARQANKCKPYVYDPTTRNGAFDGKPFTVSANRASLKFASGGVSYSNGAIIAPGVRTNLYLRSIAVYGATSFSGQVVFQRWLRMSADGRFVLASVVLGSAGDPAGVATWYSGVPPDQRGTYEFIEGGRIRFNYENGQVAVKNVFVLTAGGSADPAVSGMYLGGNQYWVPD